MWRKFFKMSRNLLMTNCATIWRRNGLLFWSIWTIIAKLNSWMRLWKFSSGPLDGGWVKMTVKIEDLFLKISPTSTPNSTTSSIKCPWKSWKERKPSPSLPLLNLQSNPSPVMGRFHLLNSPSNSRSPRKKNQRRKSQLMKKVVPRYNHTSLKA